MENQKEIWKDVLNYEGLYQVSNLGNVKSLNYNHTKVEKNLKKTPDSGGYETLSLTKNSIRKTHKVHQLVAIAFLNHKPCGFKLVVNHINFNRKDNKVENLEIITTRENTNCKHIKNSSAFVGVYWDKKEQKWISKILANKKTIRIGSFSDEKKASEWYNKALISIKKREEIQLKKPNWSSKHKGVSWDKAKNKWMSYSSKDKKHKFLGYFKTEEEARQKTEDYNKNTSRNQIENKRKN